MPSDPVFSRQETIALTGSTSNRLQFLERSKLIVPHRIGKSKKPVVLYTWEQIVAIKVLDNLTARPEVTRRIVGYLVEIGIQGDRLFLINSKSFVWASNGDMSGLAQMLGLRDVIAYYTITMIPVGAIEQQLLAQAIACETVDYADVMRRIGR